MKKILATVLVLMLSWQVIVFAQEETTLNIVGTTETDKKTVTVQIDINSEIPFCGMSFDLKYDNEILNFVDLKFGTVLENATVISNENYAENAIRIVCASAVELPKNGNVVTVTFLYDTAVAEIVFAIENCKIVGVNNEKVECKTNAESVDISTKENNSKPILGEITDNTSSEKDEDKYKDNNHDSTDSTVKNEMISPEKNDKNQESESFVSEKETTDIVDKDEEYEAFLMSFVDVNDDWFYESVKYVCEHKLMKGVSEKEFLPNSNLTRAMLVTMLYRMENEPACKATAFDDVEADMWYTNAVSWAFENSIVKGIGNGLFAPNAGITREQIAVILYNYAKYKNESTACIADLNRFTDKDDVSTWAEDAINWAVKNGIVTGKTVTALEPLGHATRAEAATMLMRYLTTAK